MLLNATRPDRGGRDVAGNVSTHSSPITVNQELRMFNAYIRENNVNWAAVTAIWPRLRYVGRIDALTGKPEAPTRPLRQSEINQIGLRLDQFLPVIVYVDASAREPGLQQHFVLIIGDDPTAEDYYIADPWHGDLSRLCPRYGETPETAICGLILYDPPASGWAGLSRAGNDAASD